MAGEPETLDSDEPLARRVERHHYDRLLMLSDGVFAIAITLLALELRPPEHWSGGFSDLIDQRWRALLGYVLGFLIVAAYWLAHRGVYARMRRVDAPATLISLLLLLLVAIAPAFVSLIADYGPKRAAPYFYGLIATIGFVQAALWAYAAFLGDLVDGAVNRPERLLTLLRLLIAPLLFAITLALGGASPSAAPILVAVVLALAIRRFAGRLAR